MNAFMQDATTPIFNAVSDILSEDAINVTQRAGGGVACDFRSGPVIILPGDTLAVGMGADKAATVIHGLLARGLM